MVNRGPSTGCLKCRERHTRCDKAKPACRRCIVRGHICPGYRDTGGVVFKDVSHSVAEKHSRRRRIPTQPPFNHIIKLKPDAQTVVIPFFFENYVLAPVQNMLTSRGHFDHLIALYSNAAPSSPLALATFATAARAMASHFGLVQNTPWHLENDMMASQAIMKAVADPAESIRDETLLAVLCLDYSTHYLKTGAPAAPSRAHLDGALALVEHRGARNFVDPVSRSLFTATRGNVLLQSLWYKDQRSEHALASFPDSTIDIANPITKLQAILMRVLKFDRFRRAVDLKDTEGRRNCIEYAQGLQVDLDAWVLDLPWDWRCTFEQFLAPGPWLPPGSSNDVYSSHVASLLAQWLCTRVMVLKALFAATPQDHGSDTSISTPRREALKLEAQAIAQSVSRLLATHSNYSEADHLGAITKETTRVVSLNLSSWALRQFEEQMPGSEGLGIAPSVLEYLRVENEKALERLEDVSPYSRTASKIGYI